MSYFIESLEYALLVGIAICFITLIITDITDAIDYHYSKKRGEIK